MTLSAYAMPRIVAKLIAILEKGAPKDAEVFGGVSEMNGKLFIYLEWEGGKATIPLQSMEKTKDLTDGVER